MTPGHTAINHAYFNSIILTLCLHKVKQSNCLEGAKLVVDMSLIPGHRLIVLEYVFLAVY